VLLAAIFGKILRYRHFSESKAHGAILGIKLPEKKAVSVTFWEICPVLRAKNLQD
jgi:hypothetical protein